MVAVMSVAPSVEVDALLVAAHPADLKPRWG